MFRYDQSNQWPKTTRQHGIRQSQQNHAHVRTDIGERKQSVRKQRANDTQNDHQQVLPGFVHKKSKERRRDSRNGVDQRIDCVGSCRLEIVLPYKVNPEKSFVSNEKIPLECTYPPWLHSLSQRDEREYGYVVGHANPSHHPEHSLEVLDVRELDELRFLALVSSQRLFHPTVHEAQEKSTDHGQDAGQSCEEEYDADALGSGEAEGFGGVLVNALHY